MGERITVVLIYVDDLIVTRDDKSEVTLIRESLLVRFEMKELGELNHFIGLEVDRCDKGIVPKEVCYRFA